jgi:hypothetical protein
MELPRGHSVPERCERFKPQSSMPTQSMVSQGWPRRPLSRVGIARQQPYYSVLALLIGLSMVGIPNYALAITTRAALVTAAGLVASHGVEIGLERVRKLLVGGLIGYLATAALNAWWRCKDKAGILFPLSHQRTP